MGMRRDGEGDSQKRGYRYRPADVQGGKADDRSADDADSALDDEVDEDEEYATGHGAGGEGNEDEFDEEADDDEGEDEPESEFWPAAELLKGATVEDAELELSYAASVYARLPAAELRLWLLLPDGTRRLVQIDEPHAVWLYRQAHRGDARDFEEYPDHRFELLCTDIRATRSRRHRQLIDRQLELHNELVAVGEELEELERDMREDEAATAGWPGTRWP